jgi:hypothetical protein
VGKIALALSLRLPDNFNMNRLGAAALLFALVLAGCKEPTPEETAFQQKFDREAVLVKTCGLDPGIASAVPIKVYRFENELWFADRGRWRRVDGKAENVCDLLDIDAAHRPAPAEPIGPPSAASRLMDLFRKSEPAPTPPKEIPPAKPNG